MEKHKVKVRMFGTLELEYNGQVLDETENRSQKLWMLLSYIIFYRNKVISQKELMDALWNQDDDGSSVLKITLHRLRKMLSEKFGEKMWVERTYRGFVYPGGESLYDAYLRMHKELCRIGEENAGKTVLAVSHSAAIRALWYYLSGYTDENMIDSVPFMVNSSYCVLEYEDGVLSPVQYNVTSHLSEKIEYEA